MSFLIVLLSKFSNIRFISISCHHALLVLAVVGIYLSIKSPFAGPGICPRVGLYPEFYGSSLNRKYCVRPWLVCILGGRLQPRRYVSIHGGLVYRCHAHTRSIHRQNMQARIQYAGCAEVTPNTTFTVASGMCKYTMARVI